MNEKVCPYCGEYEGEWCQCDRTGSPLVALIVVAVLEAASLAFVMWKFW